MFEKLPDLIDPIHCAKHNMHFKSAVNQSAMKRLVDQLVTSDNLVEVELSFYQHPGLKSPAFELKLKTKLRLECQVSLENFDYPVETCTRGVFVASLLLAEDLTEDIEVYELGEENISLLELLEDEVLLAVPMVPRKSGVDFSWQADPIETDLKAENKQTSQFAQLAELLKR